MPREVWLIRSATVADPTLNTAIARSTLSVPCRRLPAGLWIKNSGVSGTTPSITLMPQVELAGVWTDAAAVGATITAADTTVSLPLTQIPHREDQFRIVATAKSGTTPGLTGVDVVLRCGRSF